MLITRIYRVIIIPDLRREFEEKFSTISVKAVNDAADIISVSIVKPIKWVPDEYAMISVWENEASVKAFAGEGWNHVVIPSGMEKFVAECWVSL